MKYTIAIAILSLSATTTPAIYLPCCEATLGNECPPQYNTTDSYQRNDETYAACCYPEVTAEEQTTLLVGASDGDLRECFYPFVTEGGVEAAVFALPKLETAPNDTQAVVTNGAELMTVQNEEQGTVTSEATTTSGTEDTATEDLQDVTNTAEDTPTPEVAVASKNCCSVAAAMQPALRSSTKTSTCPNNMQSINGLFVTSTSTDGTKMSMQVCCEAETLAENVDVENILSCAGATTEAITAEGESESTTGEDESITANAVVNESDKSSGANTFGSTMIGIALSFGAVQAIL